MYLHGSGPPKLMALGSWQMFDRDASQMVPFQLVPAAQAAPALLRARSSALL
jgi:hypothetical protein